MKRQRENRKNRVTDRVGVIQCPWKMTSHLPLHVQEKVTTKLHSIFYTQSLVKGPHMHTLLLVLFLMINFPIRNVSGHCSHRKSIYFSSSSSSCCRRSFYYCSSCFASFSLSPGIWRKAVFSPSAHTRRNFFSSSSSSSSSSFLLPPSSCLLAPLKMKDDHKSSQ